MAISSQFWRNFRPGIPSRFRKPSDPGTRRCLGTDLQPPRNRGGRHTFFLPFLFKPSCVLLTCRSQWCWHMKTLWNRANQWKVDSNFSPIKQAAIPVEHSSTSMQRPFLGKQRFIFWNKEMVIEITMIIVMLVKNIIIIALLSTLNQASTQSHR